jgi:hypothetical protein
MNTQKLGVRQLRVIDAMNRYGDGIYQPHWVMSHTQRTILETLHRRGVVVLVDHPSGIQVYRLKGSE